MNLVLAVINWKGFVGVWLICVCWWLLYIIRELTDAAVVLDM